MQELDLRKVPANAVIHTESGQRTGVIRLN